MKIMSVEKYINSENEIIFHKAEDISEFCEYLIDQGQDIIIKWKDENPNGNVVEHGVVIWASYAAKIKDEQIILKSKNIILK